MPRWFVLLATALLAISNVTLFWRTVVLQDRVDALAAQLPPVLAEAAKLSQVLHETTTQLDALKAPQATPLKPAPPGTVLKSPASQLALAEGYKLDRVVEWIGLIEEKIYFILFPPPDAQAKERQSIDLRRRTDEFRAQFEVVSQAERAWRLQVQKHLQDGAATPNSAAGR